MGNACIAYFSPCDIEQEVIDKLRARGFTRVSLRMGLLWRGEVEDWASHIWAPGYPGIVREYVSRAKSAEVTDMPDAGQRIRPPNRVTRLGKPSAITIVSAGPNMAGALAKYGTTGTVLAVNHAYLAVKPDWHIANDGFSVLPGADIGIRMCRLVHAHSVSSGPWFAIDEVADFGNELTSLVAIRIATWVKPRHIRIIGHDCATGKTISPLCSGWTQPRLDALRDRTVDLLAAANKAGISTAWCRKVGGAWEQTKGRAQR